MRWRSPARIEVALEPLAGEPRDLLERSGLLEQVGGAGHDRELRRCSQQAPRFAVELEHDLVMAADDQQHRCAHLWQPRGREVWPSAARDDRADLLAQLRGRPQRRAGAGAGAEVADRQLGELRLRRAQRVAATSRSASRPMSNTFARSSSSSTVSRSSSSVARPTLVQRPRDLPVAGAVAARAAAVREHDQAPVRDSGRTRSPTISSPPPTGIRTSLELSNRPRWRIVGVAGQQLGDLGVRGRLEVLIPEADRPHQLRLEQADTSSASSRSDSTRLRRADRHGEDQPARLARPDRPQRRARRAAGRQPVVDDDRGAPLHLERRAAAPVALHARIDLGAGARDRGLQLLDADQQVAHDLLVEHAHVALGDRADAVLRVAGRADLSHHQHVERRPERLRDLVGDRHAAARQAEHDRVLDGERAQALGQLPSGGVPVGEPAGDRFEHQSLLNSVGEHGSPPPAAVHPSWTSTEKASPVGWSFTATNTLPSASHHSSGTSTPSVWGRSN